MIHLFISDKLTGVYAPDGERRLRFFLGSVAPDAVSDWHDKDITHFRNLSEREPALAALAAISAPDDPFAEGVLLHLYADWKWDLDIRDAYTRTLEGDWFRPYRAQLFPAGAYLYHRLSWASPLWHSMASAPRALYGKTPGASEDELAAFLSFGCEWHAGCSDIPSEAFPPELVTAFAEKTAAEYTVWRAAHI